MNILILIILMINFVSAKEQDCFPVMFDHFYFKVDKQTYEQAGKSQIFADQNFSFFEKYKKPVGTYEGHYISGLESYIEIFNYDDKTNINPPLGIGFFSEQIGCIDIIQTILTKKLPSKFNRSPNASWGAFMDYKTPNAWVWVYESTPEYVKNGQDITRISYLKSIRRQNSNTKDDYLFHNIREATFKVQKTDYEDLRKIFLALGWQQTKNSFIANETEVKFEVIDSKQDISNPIVSVKLLSNKNFQTKVETQIGSLNVFKNDNIFTIENNADTCQNTPAEFIDNRIYLSLKTGKKTLKFYTDSGGGLYPFIYDDTLRTLNLPILKTVTEGKEKISFVDLAKVFKEAGIPHHVEWKSNTRVFTYNEKSESEVSQIRFIIGDGFLGAPFFADHIWHFDYKNKNLKYCTKIINTKDFVKLPIYFKGTKKVKDTYQPRMEIEVFGKKHSMLFDTGATSLYSKEAIDIIKPFKEFTASSFVRSSVAQNWLKANPSLRFIKGGDKFGGGSDLIEIPKLKIAGLEVGPVWFATRADSIYDKYSKDIMDQNIDGAVGGSAFKFFEIITDYRNNQTYWKKVN